MGVGKVSTCPYTISKLVIGLGNPTALYRNTRHNVGKLFIETYVHSNKLSFTKIRGGDIAYIQPKGDTAYVALFKPNSFMNVSGGPVKNALNFCQLKEAKDIVVLVDDLEQQVGKVRVKDGGSPQGHNGVKSIIDVMGGKKDFNRVLIGIGRPASKSPAEVADYVTSTIPRDEKKILEGSSFPKILQLLKSSVGIDLS